MSSSSGGGLLTFLVASLGVIGLAFWVSRLVAGWQLGHNRGRRLRVLEGVPVGKDRQLLLVAVGKEVMLVGSAASGLSLIHRVEDGEAAGELLQEQPVESEAVFKPRVFNLLRLIGGPPRLDLDRIEQSVRHQLERIRSRLRRAGDSTDA